MLKKKLVIGFLFILFAAAVSLLNGFFWVFPSPGPVEAKQKSALVFSSLNFQNDSAEVSVYVDNSVADNFNLVGEAVMEDGIGKALWQKDFAIAGMRLNQKARLDFTWPAGMNLIGRPGLRVVLKNEEGKIILSRKNYFVVLPGVLSGAVLVALAFVGSRGAGKLLGLV